MKAINKVEKLILVDEELIAGLNYGKPRRGHPEGAVKNHVQEILGFIGLFYFSEREVNILRFLAFIHDSFKLKVDKSKPKTGENHHGWLARQFATKYVNCFGDDAEQILEMLQWHDEAYNIYRKFPKINEERLVRFLERPIIDWDLFLRFMYIDSSTGDKDNYSTDWFYGILLEKGLV